MKKQILEELNDIKYLFNYNRGKVISEQEKYESEEIDFEEIDDEDDDEDINYLKGEFNEEYDDDEEYKDRSMYDPYYGDDDEEEFDFGFESPFCKSCEGRGCEECDGSGMKRNSVGSSRRDGMDTGEDLAPSFDSDGNFLGMVKPNRDDMDTRTPEERERDRGDIGMELEEEMDLPVMLPGTKEKERIKVDPGTKPKKPGTPYSPKPGPKKNPKARKGDMPTWLSFKSLGINLK